MPGQASVSVTVSDIWNAIDVYQPMQQNHNPIENTDRQQINEYNNQIFNSVDCLKNTEEKSSENRVCTPDARLIRAIYAKSKCRAQDQCSSFNAMAKTQGSKPASPHYYNTRTRGAKSASPLHYDAKTRGATSAPLFQCISQNAEFEVRVSTSLHWSRRRAWSPPVVPRRKERSPRLDITASSRCRARSPRLVEFEARV